MERLNFNSDGKLVAVDSGSLPKHKSKPNFSKYNPTPTNKNLSTSSSLKFLQEETPELTEIFDNPNWSLYNSENQALNPLTFSNGKTQEDIVKEITSLISEGKKVIFLHGVCGSGKSAIALNVARSLNGKASIVVPIKSLQKQYEQDYVNKTYLVKPNGKKMRIAMITGRDNHDSIIEPGKSCADPFLPDTIKLTEKNYNQLKEYYKENPFINSNTVPSINKLKRISVAPSNPHWSPILPAEIEINVLKDATKRKYLGMYGREYIFYHRKPGCSYYDQYLSYLDADVIIFNSAKYLAESSMGRKPQTDVDIIDEADEFLDSLSNQIDLNLSRLSQTLRMLVPDSDQAIDSIKKILNLIDAEETKIRAIGFEKEQVHHIDDTNIKKILQIILEDTELQAEIAIDETNYSNQALEAAKNFKDSFKDTYLMYSKDENNLHAELVTTNLAQKFNQLVDGNRALVLMSGTLHSESVLKNIFGLENFATVEAETLNQGSVEIHMTGKEFDCRYSNLRTPDARKNYLQAFSQALEKAKRPTLIQVNAYSDLPTDEETLKYNITNITSKEALLSQQQDDKVGKRIQLFKSGFNETLFTTRASRGIDFPGDTCNSIVFTKYPNPNVRDIFFTILQKTHPDYYWDFYKDKAEREFLQRLYRAVRSKDDHVYILSPDTRVLDAVKKLQTSNSH